MAKDAGYERTGERRRPRGTSEPLHPKIRQRPLGRMAEAHLAELEAMVEGITEGLLVCDVTGNVLRMNRRAREIHGDRSAEKTRRTYADYTNTFDLCDPEGHPIPMEQCPLARAARGETFRKMEVRIREKHSGREWTGYCAGVPIRDERGNVTFGVLTFRDVSRPGLAQQTEFVERRHVEEALRESEQRYRSIVETANEGIWVATLEGKTTYVNPRMAEMLGCSCEEMLGRGTLEFVFPEDQSVGRREFEHCWSEAAGRRVCLRYRRRGGSELWAEVSTSTLRGPDGKPRVVLRMLTDITEHKRAEEILRQLNDRLEEQVVQRTEELTATIDRLQDQVGRRILAEGKLRKHSQMFEGFFQHTIAPLAFMDRDFNFIRVNDAYAQADGRPPEFFVGKNHFALYPNEENQAIFEQVVRTGQPYSARAKPFVYPDHPERGITYWDWRLTPLLDESGDVQSLVLNLENVTQQQVALRELERRARQLQKLTLELSEAEDRERKRMADVLHDDLQQVLAAARFQLGLLKDGPRSDGQHRQITEEVRGMLEDAIEKSRSLSHELSPAVLSQSDLDETFEWLARQMESKHGLTVHVEIRGQVESHSEPLRALLYKAAREMLFNAVKHADVTEARLRLQQVRGQFWLTISDNGKGFDPTSLAEAAGLGLLSIRERVELLGGRMKIRSIEGRGSTFLIAVPGESVPPSDEHSEA